MRYSLFPKLVCLIAGLGLLQSAHAAIVRVTTELAPGGDVIEVGETTTVTVKALVEEPTPGRFQDGIFTFDVDLIIANLLSGGPQLLDVVSVNRPDVDDATYGGSDGTETTEGLVSVSGGYNDDFRGIGSPQILFTVQLKGLSIGTASVTPGPSDDPPFFSTEFVLYNSGEVSATYDAGVRIQIDPASFVIPLPSSLIGGLALGTLLIGSRLRYTARHVTSRRC